MIAKNLSIIDYFILYLVILNFISFIKASLANPGALPYSEISLNLTDDPVVFFENVLDDMEYSRLEENVVIAPLSQDLKRDILFLDSKTGYSQKYCISCNIFRPFNASHCSECGFCILDKDHHCFWLDNCIGRNNYEFYYGFVFSLMLLNYIISYAIRCFYEADILNMQFYLITVSISIIVSVLYSIFSFYNLILVIFNLSSKEFKILPFSRYPEFSLKKLLSRIRQNKIKLNYRL